MSLRPPHLFLVCLALTGAPLAPAAPAGAGLMMHQLESRDWIRRAEALRYLGRHRVEEAIPAVRSIRDDAAAGPWIRGRALVALAEIEGKVAPGEFGAWVAHELPELRAAAAEILEVRGGQSAETWIAILLEDEVEAVRFQAAASSARRHGAETWPLVGPLTRDPNLTQPRLAARALALVGTEPALQRLAALAANHVHLSEVIRGIGDLTNPVLIPVLLEILTTLAGEDLLSSAVLTALQNHEWMEVIAALDRMIRSGDETNLRTAAQVMHRLTRSASLGPPLRAALAAATRSDTLEAGLIALVAPTMEPDTHHEFFAQNLSHQDPKIRALAVRCLSHCETVNLYDSLGATLADRDLEVVRAALHALQSAPVRTAPQGRLVSYLQEALSHPDEEIRNLAYELLGHAGSSADFRPAMAALAPLLAGSDDTLRAAAAKALGAIAPPESIGEVVQAQGYLAKWKVIGTFLNDDQNSAFDQVFPPEEKIDFAATYPSRYVWVVEGQQRRDDDELIEREVAWGDGTVDATDGRLIMSAQLPPPGSYAVGYAVADFHLEVEREALLDIDGDDAFRVWLNGVKVAEKSADFSKRDESVVSASGLKVTLKRGANRLFVKTANHQFQWWVRVRLTDANRKPIVFTTP